MTGHVNHERKDRILAKRELELLHAIKNGFPSQEVASRAEEVREAKIRAFKCRFAKSSALQPYKFSPEEMAANSRQVREWLSLSTADIVEIYRPKGPGAGT
jgi:hypothetical protein